MSVLYFFESIRSPFLTALNRFFTLFGEEVLIFAVLCILLWCVDKKLAIKIGLVFFVSGMLVQVLKLTFRVERPWVIDPNFHPVEEVLSTATGYSFPSGHTQGATALFASLGCEAWMRKKKWFSAVCLLIFLLVGTSRMYLGVHTPADVIVAMLLTLAVTLLIFIISGKSSGVKGKGLGVSIAFLIFSAAAFAYSCILISNGSVPLDEGVDCCKAAGAGFAFAIGLYLDRNYIKFDTSTPKMWMQPVKLIVGVLTALAFKEGLKYIIGTSVTAQFIRYFIVIMWVLTLYPLIVKTLLKKYNIKKGN